MIRRVMGLETEYGLMTARKDGAPSELTVDEAAHVLFSRIVALGRSTNAFLPNGSRLYLDVGSHPEFATAECDDIADLVALDRAGEMILASMVADANEKLAERGEVMHLLKNNVDSEGNSFGCHENYLIRRRRDFRARVESLVPFFITRQILTGAGHIRTTPEGAEFEIAQRSDQVWDAISSATTRTRPIVNTRDEPHGDADKYRRMHVIVGDSNMSEVSTALKVTMVELLLTLIDDVAPMPDVKMAEPMKAIRAISHDLDFTATFETSSGNLTAIQIQRIYAETALNYLDQQGYLGDLDPIRRSMADLWVDGLDHLERGELDPLSTKLDWVAKRFLFERYRSKNGLGWDDPRLARLELAYHDVSPAGGLAASMMSKGLLERVVTDEQVNHATHNPPATTRAAMRGAFVSAAIQNRRDYMADWTSLRIMDGERSRTVLVNDPFETSNPQVDELIEALCDESA